MSADNGHYNLDVSFGLNPARFTEGVLKIQKELSGLNTSFEENKRKISDTLKEISRLRGEQKKLADTIEKGGKATEEQEAEMKKLANQVAYAYSELGQLRSTETVLKTAIKESTNELQKQMGLLEDNTKSAGEIGRAHV